ncbi:hypothetical protein H7X67_07870, partial [Dysgonomonas sp. HGC4]
KRRVARFDISNIADDGQPGNPTGTNFFIQSILISNAKYAGYLTDENSTGASIPSGNLTPISYTGINNGDTESEFYLWPTVLDVAESQTVISIEGVFNRIKQIYKVIPTADISIDANHRYILKVKRVKLDRIEFNIVAADWNDAKDILGEPTIGAVTFSVLSNPTVGTGGVFNASALDGNVTNYEGSGATGTAVLEITTSSYYSGASDYRVTNNNGTNNSGSDITVTKSETVTYAGAVYNTVYTITIPQQTSPVDRKITIASVADSNNRKEIVIKAVPNYFSTSYKPVLLGGIYWAPVNVGAIYLDYAATLTSCGLLYQWGRSYGSVYGVSGGDIQKGPVSLVNVNGIYANNFITSFDNWLYVDGSTTTQADADALWTGANAQGPCPAGWRLPTSTELDVIVSRGSFSGSRLSVPGDEAGQTLYLPAAGYRDNFSGAFYGQGTSGRYWSSTIDGTRVLMWDFNASHAITRATGLSVRCVQE